MNANLGAPATIGGKVIKAKSVQSTRELLAARVTVKATPLNNKAAKDFADEQAIKAKTGKAIGEAGLTLTNTYADSYKNAHKNIKPEDLVDAWQPVEGQPNTYDAYISDLFDEGSANILGHVTFRGEALDLRKFKHAKETVYPDEVNVSNVYTGSTKNVKEAGKVLILIVHEANSNHLIEARAEAAKGAKVQAETKAMAEKALKKFDASQAKPAGKKAPTSLVPVAAVMQAKTSKVGKRIEKQIVTKRFGK